MTIACNGAILSGGLGTLAGSKNIGLAGLYEAFGDRPFRGYILRDVMVKAVGGAEVSRAGWQAAIALGRLKSSGVVDVVNASEGLTWNGTYKLSELGLAIIRRTLGEEDVEQRTQRAAPLDRTPGVAEYMSKLEKRESLTVKGPGWRKWAFVDWAIERGLIEQEEMVRINLTDQGRKWLESKVDPEPVQGHKVSTKAGAKITARIYHLIRAKGLSPAQAGVTLDELCQAMGVSGASAHKQIVAAVENGYLREGSLGYQVVLEGEES